MSRVGKLPIKIYDGVDVVINNLTVTATGPKGSLSKSFRGDISITKESNLIVVKPRNETKHARAMWGTARSIIANMIKGVSEGFSQELEIIGVGYKASINSNFLNLALGKSHNTKIEIPNGIKATALKQNLVKLESYDKELLGGFSSVVISQRPPEPYKGKGIKRKGQYIQRKEGKKN